MILEKIFAWTVLCTITIGASHHSCGCHQNSDPDTTEELKHYIQHLNEPGENKHAQRKPFTEYISPDTKGEHYISDGHIYLNPSSYSTDSITAGGLNHLNDDPYHQAALLKQYWLSHQLGSGYIPNQGQNPNFKQSRKANSPKTQVMSRDDRAKLYYNNNSNKFNEHNGEPVHDYDNTNSVSKEDQNKNSTHFDPEANESYNDKVADNENNYLLKLLKYFQARYLVPGMSPLKVLGIMPYEKVALPVPTVTGVKNTCDKTSKHSKSVPRHYIPKMSPFRRGLTAEDEINDDNPYSKKFLLINQDGLDSNGGKIFLPRSNYHGQPINILTSHQDLPVTVVTSENRKPATINIPRPVLLDIVSRGENSLVNYVKNTKNNIADTILNKGADISRLIGKCLDPNNLRVLKEDIKNQVLQAIPLDYIKEIEVASRSGVEPVLPETPPENTHHGNNAFDLVENEDDDDDGDFRIIGGNAATGSGTPLSNKGRSGFVY